MFRCSYVHHPQGAYMFFPAKVINYVHLLYTNKH